jgi:hypothetical protein
LSFRIGTDDAIPIVEKFRGWLFRISEYVELCAMKKRWSMSSDYAVMTASSLHRRQSHIAAGGSNNAGAERVAHCYQL